MAQTLVTRVCESSDATAIAEALDELNNLDAPADVVAADGVKAICKMLNAQETSDADRRTCFERSCVCMSFF